MDRGARRRPSRAGPRAQRPDAAAAPLQGLRRRPAPHPPAARPPRLVGAGDRAVLAGTARAAVRVSTSQGLARLLYLSSGVTRRTTRPDGGVVLFRAAGSAGGRFPLELYVAVPARRRGSRASSRACTGTTRRTTPSSSSARPRRATPSPSSSRECRGAPAGATASAASATSTGTRARCSPRLLALADSAGLTARLFTTFPDAEVAALVGADRVHEFPVALVALGPRRPGRAPDRRCPVRATTTPTDSSSRSSRPPSARGSRRALGAELERGAPVSLTAPSGGPSTDAVVVEQGLDPPPPPRPLPPAPRPRRRHGRLAARHRRAALARRQRRRRRADRHPPLARPRRRRCARSTSRPSATSCSPPPSSRDWPATPPSSP